MISFPQSIVDKFKKVAEDNLASNLTFWERTKAKYPLTEGAFQKK